MSKTSVSDRVKDRRSDGGEGYFGIYTPTKSQFTLKVLMWLFFLLDPGQIRYHASFAFLLELIMTFSLFRVSVSVSGRCVRILDINICFIFE